LATETPPAGRDPEASSKLQILATEHWSLLATRSLTYTESLARVNIFLAVLSGAVIALALVAQVDHFGTAFTTIAIPVLFVVLFTGIATISRLMVLNRDDYRWVVAMNRLRHGYLEMHPELAPNFMTSTYDDYWGALQTLGIDRPVSRGALASVFHLPQTLPGMLGVIVAAVAAAIAALAVRAVAGPAPAMGLAGALGFVLVLAWMVIWNRRSFGGPAPSLEPNFPTPAEPSP
jgi:hypothetical protein